MISPELELELELELEELLEELDELELLVELPLELEESIELPPLEVGGPESPPPQPVSIKITIMVVNAATTSTCAFSVLLFCINFSLNYADAQFQIVAGAAVYDNSHYRMSSHSARCVTFLAGICELHIGSAPSQARAPSCITIAC